MKLIPHRILVIGGGGFLGRALTQRLREDGHDIDVLLGHHTELTESGVRVHADGLENLDLLRRVLPTCQTLIHVASGTRPGDSALNPSLECELNIRPTLGLLEVLREYSNVHLIYFSSGGTVYGEPSQSPVPEEAPLRPLSYHGATKVAIETFLRCYESNFSGRVTVLRPSNVYGPGQPYDSRFGVIRAMLEHAKNGTTVSIWGDGSTTRDFVYIDDLTSACAHAVANANDHGTYNVGSGKGTSLNELRRVVELVSGRPLQVKYEPARGIDVRRVVLDTTRIRDRLGWEPKVKLENGIERTWRWLVTQ